MADSEEWYTLNNAATIILNEVCINNKNLAKHLNHAFNKGKQIGSGQALSELESLKSRLPINADGDVVLWGDDQYFVEESSFDVTNAMRGASVQGRPEQKKMKVMMISCHDENGWNVGNDDGWWPVRFCHSSSASCKAAMKGGE